MNKQSSKIVIPCCDSYEFIELSNIIRFEGLQNYTKVYIIGSKPVVSSTNIGYFKTSLQNQGFFCCHKSHLVNEKHILRYLKSGLLELSDDSSVPVSRRKRPVFLAAILEKFSPQQDKDKDGEPVLVKMPIQELQQSSYQ